MLSFELIIPQIVCVAHIRYGVLTVKYGVSIVGLGVNGALLESVKKSAKRILDLLNLSLTRDLSPGVKLFGWAINLGSTPAKTAVMGSALLSIIGKRVESPSILEIGVGDGQLSSAVLKVNRFLDYEAIDLGNSNDFRQNSQVGFPIHQVAFLDFNGLKKYDIVYASHFIEHQNNVGMTVEKILDLVKPGGYIILEWPLPHRKLFGGHMSMMTPALLAYNFAKQGCCTVDSTALIQGKFCALVIKAATVDLPQDLQWDTGELSQLRQALPDEIYEDCDSYVVWDCLEIRSEFSSQIKSWLSE